MVEDLQKIDFIQEELADSKKETAEEVETAAEDEVVDKTEPTKKAKQKPFKKPLPKKIKYLLIILAVLLAILVISGLGVFILGRPVVASVNKTAELGREAYQAIKSQNLVEANKKLDELKTALRETEKKYKKLSWLKILPLARPYYLDGERGFAIGLNGVEAALLLTKAIEPYADVLGFEGEGSFSGGTAEDRIVKIVQTLDKITPQLDEVINKLDFCHEEFEKINPDRYPEEIKGRKIKENIFSANKMLGEFSLGIKEAKPIISVLPRILGYPNSRNYLVIFQNDGELRPTGGFMTAFSVLKVDSGKIIVEKSDDIYSLDRKFKSRLKPPEPIKEYLFSNEYGKSIVPYYYLRDMNFLPDFKESMSSFKKYYDDLSGEYKVEGIITVDTFVLKDLVEIIGSINVPGYGEFTIEPDKRCHDIANIICELEYIVDEPLATQVENRKQSVLGPMMKELILKAMGSPKQIWPNLFATALKSLKEKHVLIYFEDEEMQKAMEAFNAAGRVKDYEGDYLHINDANFGGAKSNMFVQHTVEQEIEIDEAGKITKTLTLTYENPEKMDDCGLERKGGLCLNSILRNYVRIYVPKGSKLIEALGSEVEMKENEELGKTYFDGFLTVRGGGGRAKLTVIYELPFNHNHDEPYKLLIQKQPGTLGHKYIIHFGEKEEEVELRTDREFEF